MMPGWEMRWRANMAARAAKTAIRNMQILVARGSGMTLKAIAAQHGLSRNRVWQVVEKDRHAPGVYSRMLQERQRILVNPGVKV